MVSFSSNNSLEWFVSGIFVVRDDSFLNHAVDEEASYFAHLHCVPVSCRDFVAASFEKYAVRSMCVCAAFRPLKCVLLKSEEK